MLQKLGKFFLRVNFNGFLLGLDKLCLFKPCLPAVVQIMLIRARACQVHSANVVDLRVK